MIIVIILRNNVIFHNQLLIFVSIMHLSRSFYYNYCAPYCQNVMDVPLVVQGCVLVAGIQKDDEMNMAGTVEGEAVRKMKRSVY